jgi:hypothetical protein
MPITPWFRVMGWNPQRFPTPRAKSPRYFTMSQIAGFLNTKSCTFKNIASHDGNALGFRQWSCGFTNKLIVPIALKTAARSQHRCATIWPLSWDLNTRTVVWAPKATNH